MTTSVTFVTAFLTPEELGVSHRKMDKYYGYFKVLAETCGDRMVAFVSHSLFDEFSGMYPQVKFLPIRLEDLNTYKCAELMGFDNITLPQSRDPEKDNAKFMCMINAKTEFVRYTIDHITPRTTHYAWIDFGIAHITSEPEIMLKNLAMQTSMTLKSPMFAIPGCHDNPGLPENLNARVNWRFCGGFFIGDTDSVGKFCVMSFLTFQDYLEKHHTLTWEVNMWSYLEMFHEWKPDWFRANHDPSMLDIPAKHFVSRNVPKVLEHKIPNVTFVTAYIDLKEGDDVPRRNTEKYIEDFGYVARTGLSLVVFLSPHLIDRVARMYPGHKYVPIELEDTFAYKEASKDPRYKAPDRPFKDRCTARCLVMQNAKTEFVRRAIDLTRENPSNYYAWIDFGIKQMLGDKPEQSLQKLKEQSELIRRKSLMALPGVWKLGERVEIIGRDIMWRFCGSYFIGDVKSLINFDELMRKVWPEFLRTYRIIIWEINIWAKLELVHGWKPDWYASNHHDRIYLLPDNLL